MHAIIRPKLISTSRHRKRNENLGPGYYYDEAKCSTLGGPQISISCRYPEPAPSLADITPDPGTYYVDLQPTSPGVTFHGRRDRPIIPFDYPGPTSYNMVQSPSSPSFYINCKPRFKTPLSCLQLPGPTSYEPQRRPRHIPQFSFQLTSGRMLNTKGKTSPGPGAYNPQLLPVSMPTIRIGPVRSNAMSSNVSSDSCYSCRSFSSRSSRTSFIQNSEKLPFL
jgi:hypothetical protein